MMERISIRRQGLRRSKRDIRERKTRQQCRYNGDGKERGEVDEIFFRLGARVDRNTVNPHPPQPRMDVVMMDASPEVQ